MDFTACRDPYVYRHTDGSYYFTASVPAYDGIVLRRAGSLAELSGAEEVMIWKKHESGPMSYHIWAPEIHYLFGKWYIYFAGGEKEDIWKIRPYVLECSGDDPLTDEWVELGKMKRAARMSFLLRHFRWMRPSLKIKVNIIMSGQKRSESAK